MRKLFVFLFLILSYSVYAITEKEFFKKYPNGEVIAVIGIKRDTRNFKYVIQFYNDSKKITENPEGYFGDKIFKDELNSKVNEILFYFPHTKNEEVIFFQYNATKEHKGFLYIDFENNEKLKNEFNELLKEIEFGFLIGHMNTYEESKFRSKNYLTETGYIGRDKKNITIFFGEDRKMLLDNRNFIFSKEDKLSICFETEYHRYYRKNQKKDLKKSYISIKKETKEKDVLFVQKLVDEEFDMITKSESSYDKFSKLSEENIQIFDLKTNKILEKINKKYIYLRNDDKNDTRHKLKKIITESESYNKKGEILSKSNEVKINENNYGSIRPINLLHPEQFSLNSLNNYKTVGSIESYDKNSFYRKMEYKEEKINDDEYLMETYYDNDNKIIRQEIEKKYYENGDLTDYRNKKDNVKFIEEKHNQDDLIEKQIQYWKELGTKKISEIYNRDGLIRKSIGINDETMRYDKLGNLEEHLFNFGSFVIEEKYKNNKIKRKITSYIWDDNGFVDKDVIEDYDNDKVIKKTVIYSTKNPIKREYNVEEYDKDDKLLKKRVFEKKEYYKNEKKVVEYFLDNKFVKKYIFYESQNNEYVEAYNENNKLDYIKTITGILQKKVSYDDNGNILNTEWSDKNVSEEYQDAMSSIIDETNKRKK